MIMIDEPNKLACEGKAMDEVRDQAIRGIVMGDNLGEELYNLLADLLNQRTNRAVFDSLRGEYGVLRYLAYVENHVSAGQLTERLHVVPGRMTDILKSLEHKRLIERQRDGTDRRKVNVVITEIGRQQAKEMRQHISDEYRGLFEILSRKDTEELIRLLKIVLSYHENLDDETAENNLLS